MGVKALSGSFEELSSRVEVNFGTGNRGVPQIGREQRKLGCEIGALSIPGHEAMDSKRVTQVVNARACLTLGTTKPNLPQDFQKESHKSGMSVSVPDDVEENRGIGSSRKPGLPTLGQIDSEVLRSGR